MNKRSTTKMSSKTQHCHRGRIDEPNGPLSLGRCFECGAVKEFKNWLSEGDFITNEEHRMSRAA